MNTRVDIDVATAITETIRDYFEGWYDADPERMGRALHPELAKRTQEDDGSVRTTTRDRMLELTVAGEGRDDGSDRTLEIAIADRHDGIATAVVRSAVYREYLQLVRTEEGWRIVNALWAPS